MSSAAALTLLTELLPTGVLPAMAASLHTTPSRIGFLASAFATASTVAAIPLTTLALRLPRRALLLGLLAGLAVANTITAVSSSYPLTLLVRVAAGLVNGMLWSMLAGYAARMVPAAQRGRAVAITLAGITVTLAAGLPAATALARWVGWRVTFALVAALAAVLVVWIRATVPPIGGATTGGLVVSLMRTLRTPGVRIVLATTCLLLAGHQTLYTYISPFVAQAGIDHVSLVLLAFGAAAVAGIWVTGTVIDRHLRTAMLIAAGLFATTMLTLGALATHHPAVMLGAVVAWGLAFGGIPTLLQTALIDAAGSGQADTATAMQTTVYNAAIAAGSLLGGIILDHGSPAGLPWTPVALATAGLATVATARHHGFPAKRQPM
ncbi:MAG: MFS transporter [Streptosporangiales bacterium]